MPSSWGGFIVVKEKLLREKYPTISYFHFLQSLLVQGKINTLRSTTSSFVLLSFGRQSQETQEKQRNKSPPPQKIPPSHEKTPRRANLTARKHSRMPYFPQDLRITQEFQTKTSRSTTSSTHPLLFLRLRITLEPAGKTKRGQKKNSKNPTKFVANS